MNPFIRKICNGAMNWMKSVPNIWNHDEIHIITDGHDWVVNEVSKSLTKNLMLKKRVRVRVSPFLHFLSGKIIHYNAVSVPNKLQKNKVIMTWYHVNKNDPRLKRIKQIASRVDLLHTTAESTKAILIQHGFPQEKIRVIPMGIDLEVFTPASTEERKKTRASLGIPPNTFVIGSFQKDGDGWSDGMNPKWIKGPDVFCDVVERLAKHMKIHVLLSGPARGYVKDRLMRASIPFTHHFVKEYKEINTLYQALDVYLIASRIEGVPMALLESWATGTPLVSTRVGMVSDVAIDQETALLADVEDRDKLTAHILQIYKDPSLRNRLVKNASEEVQNYDWKILIDRYWNELYKHLL